MNGVLKGLAIAMLLVTIVGAGAVLYGLQMFAPQVEFVRVTATPAEQAGDAFDALMAQIDRETFAGKIFGETAGLYAQDCTFLTYTVRLNNRGFFPAEWLSIEVEPLAQDQMSYDVLQMDGSGANVLAVGSQGDLSATILRVGDAQQTARNLKIACYVFGQKVEFAAQAQ